MSFGQVGIITFTFQVTASLVQPLVGVCTDRRPMPFSLVTGMVSTLLGLVLLSVAWSFPLLLLAVGLVGLGSAVFHPEASRLAYLAAGERRGLAQSLFSVGGNAGASLGPLLAAAIIARGGRSRVLWFSLVALLGILILWRLGKWYKEHTIERQRNPQNQRRAAAWLWVENASDPISNMCNHPARPPRHSAQHGFSLSQGPAPSSLRGEDRPARRSSAKKGGDGEPPIPYRTCVTHRPMRPPRQSAGNGSPSPGGEGRGEGEPPIPSRTGVTTRARR